MPTIGEQLRAAREAKGLAIDDAHRHTKIHTKILRAMEEDRMMDVLETAYAKGFLRKYATFLSLDPEPLVQAYLTSTTTTTTSVAGGQGSDEASPARWVGPAAITVIALIGIAFLGFLARDLYHTVSSPTVPAAAVHAAASAGQQTPEPPPPPPPKMIVPKSQTLKLSIRAAQDCWMQVKADDKVLFQNVLGKGREETWTATEALELWVGNAAALTLTLNGHPLEPLGPGVLKGIRVTRSGVHLPKAARRAP